jgi:hypothetical protein
MDVIMKFLCKYLKVTSVLFHIALLASLYWVIPYYKNVQANFKIGINSSEYENTAIVKDITEISRNGLKYKGYLVEMDGQNLYVPSMGDNSIIVGEEVQIMTMVNSFKDLNTLFAIALKK